MFFTELNITNYKGFQETGPIPLNQGFNIVVGRNNSGKTAFLEALSLTFNANPYRGPEIPRDYPVPDDSKVKFKFQISGRDMRSALLRTNSFHLPVPQNHASDAKTLKNILDKLLESQQVAFTATRTSQNQYSINDFPSHPFYSEKNYAHVTNYGFNVDRSSQTFSPVGGRSGDDTFAQTITKSFAEHVYAFRAERLGIGACKFGNNRTLLSNASNLAEVLNILQSNPIRFRKFNEYVREIFDNVLQISVRPSSQSRDHVEVLVWTIDPDTERDDLAIRLSDSGTGVGQVLSILYVVLTSDLPRVIVIDEPNTFLHPGAVKKIIDILKLYPQHQYIFATHSPDLISYTEPNNVIKIEHIHNKSTCARLDLANVQSCRNLLDELGASLSDVFGADQVLWVEGKTEERCFPIIITQAMQERLKGVSIVAVRSTGDFEARKIVPDMIWEVYEKISNGNALVPTAIGFIFDREGRSESKIRDLSKMSGGKLKFLERRSFENYLLHIPSLCLVMREEGVSVEEEEVQDWVAKESRKVEYFGSKENVVLDAFSDKWLKRVKAARLLKTMFQHFSNKGVEYRKIAHGQRLTQLIARDEPDNFRDISNIVKRFLEPRNRARTTG